MADVIELFKPEEVPSMTHFNEKFASANAAFEEKQDKISGTLGQVVGFDANGKAVAQDAPDGGVSSFNGRKGAVIPEEGDYTASQVGAVPSTGGEMTGTLKLSMSGTVLETDYPNGEIVFLIGGGEIALMAGQNAHTGETTVFIHGVHVPFNDTDAANKAYVDGEIQGLTAADVGAIPASDADSFAKKGDLTNVYKYKGSVSTFGNLPAAGNNVGDVWNVEKNDMNYGWTGTDWDPLGQIFSIRSMTNAEIDEILAT